jgi:uncharacterized protein DUF547
MHNQNSSYHGPFYWLATLSFLVPLVVAFSAFRAIPWSTKPTPCPDASGVDHALWDDLLKTYVENGLFDYGGLKRDYLFRTYLRQLARADPTKLASAADRLALLSNAYNALVVHGVITHKIDVSVMEFSADQQGFFDLQEHIFAGRTVSLNHIEHELIRQQYQDPRIHVALVCAARGCPAIRGEAYIGTELDRQLEDQSRLFANDDKYVAFDQDAGRLRLSPILKWYQQDWGSQAEVLSWLKSRIVDPARIEAIDQAVGGEIDVEYLPYDWSLNAQATSGIDTSTSGKSGTFGSGSIPNE